MEPESTDIPVAGFICEARLRGRHMQVPLGGGFLGVGGVPILRELSLQMLLIQVAPLRLLLYRHCYTQWGSKNQKVVRNTWNCP